MSANPIGGPMMGHHAILDEEPLLTQHGAGPSLGHAIVESAPAVDPDADFWLDRVEDIRWEDLDEQFDRIEQLLNDAHGLTGQDDVVDTYGFDGTGQTVAVIDSGIAYNHYALGGGRGDGYRVVGGWDFTENDADFYDDGPEGSHGTHVAGIVGAVGDGAHSGVATGVDMVGLRVFDDAGNGYFSWVEQALQWVHTNRNAFDNPITAVNLSLGTEWNSDSVPSWAMLENEFAQLEADGIFVSVSAGNSYTSYNTKGVSYPAASDHVVPVMSVDNNGQLSYFSQRAEYAIAAPGRWITSTVPDYAANDGDTIDDDWLSMSGTSMAAPYVAGASMLIREAMDFVGQTGVDQWDIYDHMMATADTFYDSATDTNYKRLNLEAAIDALMPEDDYGSSVATAHNLGTLNDTSSANPLSTVSGVISTLDDADYFTFTAGVTGQVTINAANSTHALDAEWDAWGGSWSTHESGGCVLDVVAGQTYTVALSSSDGLGYYDLDVNVESTFAAIEWGSVGVQETRNWQPSTAEEWFTVTAGRTGYFTVESLPQNGSASVAIYDAQQNLLASAGSRADVQVAAGDTLMLRVTGDSTEYNLRMTNALTDSGGVATLVGTTGDDALAFIAGTTEHTVELNGVSYSLDAAQVSEVSLNGASGEDAIVLNALDGVTETASIQSGWGQVASSAYRTSFMSVESVTVNAQFGDTAYLYDTVGDESLVADADSATLTGVGFDHTASGFGRTFVFANQGGSDTAQLYDGATNDQFVATPNYSVMRSLTGEFHHYLSGFDAVTAYSTSGGNDVAQLYDGVGDDVLLARPDYTEIAGEGGAFLNRAEGFSRVLAFATAGGADSAMFYDGAGDEVFVASPDYAAMSTSDSSFFNYASGFGTTQAFATGGGTDVASLYDGVTDDDLYATPNLVRLTGSGDAFENSASGFTRVNVFALLGGSDTATLYDGVTNDQYVGTPDYAYLRDTGGSFFNYLYGFDEVSAYALAGGANAAYLYDSAGDDEFTGGTTVSTMQTAGHINRVTSFDTVLAFAQNGGDDLATLEDSSGDDAFYGRSDYAYRFSGGGYRYARGFDTVRADSSLGSDTADVDTLDYVFEQTGVWA